MANLSFKYNLNFTAESANKKIDKYLRKKTGAFFLAVENAAHESADETKAFIASKTKRKRNPLKRIENTIAHNITVKKIVRRYSTGFGIGSHTMLNTNAPHWVRINNGFLPPKSTGFFNGNLAPMNGRGTDYFTPNKGGHPLRPRVAYRGMFFAEHLKSVGNKKRLQIRRDIKKGL